MMGEEHSEIAAIADAFEDWDSARFRRGRRKLGKRLRLNATGIRLARCWQCGALAEWDYAPAGEPWHACDVCVPRGCACRITEDDRHVQGRTVTEEQPDGRVLVWTEYEGPEPRQELDSLGRELPCVEWDYFSGGFPRPRQDRDGTIPASREA